MSPDNVVQATPLERLDNSNNYGKNAISDGCSTVVLFKVDGRIGRIFPGGPYGANKC